MRLINESEYEMCTISLMQHNFIMHYDKSRLNWITCI